MSIKITMVFICAAIGTIGGYFVMRGYRRNYDYLMEMCKVIERLKLNISYRRDTVVDVLCAIGVKNVLLKRNIQEYAAFVASKTDKPIISRGFLCDEIYADVCDVFYSIGQSDGSTQKEQLVGFLCKFTALRTDAEHKCAKYGAVAVKLGFLLGLGIGVLTL